jgi:hypothetical protein
MEYPINADKINQSTEFFEEAQSMHIKAQAYLDSHMWCEKIIKGWLFTNLGKVLCIFLYEIENNQSNEDNFLWVIVWDFPSMYLDIFSILSTKEVVEAYCNLVEDWIETAESGKSLEECFPLKASNSAESIEMLRKRITFFRNSLLLNMDNIHYSAYKGA